MWVRRIVKHGTAHDVTIPVEVLRALKWERGDHLYIRLHDGGELRIKKFDPARVSDRERAALQPEPIMHYE